MIRSISTWENPVLRLSADQARLIAESDLATVEFHQPPDYWRVVTNSRVGTVDGADWSLRVEPKIPIPRLMFLLGYASDPKGWRNTLSSFKSEDLFSAVANGFSVLASRAIEPTPLRGYTRIDERSSSFRGRIRIEDQLARTVPFPFEISYDDHTIDTPENRVLLAAAERLLRFPRVPIMARKRLMRIRALLDGVQARLASRGPITITRLNEQYRPAMKLASLVLANKSLSTRSGSNTSATFMFDMNRVYEDFLSEALSDAIRRLGGQVRLQFDDKFLDRQQKIKLVPDIVWWEDGKPKAVVDAKFKQIHNSRFPNADAYQMLAYCTGLSVGTAFLIYARDLTETNRDHDLVTVPVSIRVRHLDLTAEPDALLAQVDDLAAEIQASFRRGSGPEGSPPAAIIGEIDAQVGSPSSESARSLLR